MHGPVYAFPLTQGGKTALAPLCDSAPGLRSTKGDFMERRAGSLGLIFLSVNRRAQQRQHS